jgi:hypothetical protein
MFTKRVDDLMESDLLALVQNSVHESKTLEYKLDVPKGSRLAQSACSFANTVGGFILLGVEEKSGVPTDLPGFDASDVDDLKLRIEGMISNAMEPPLRGVDIKPIKVSSGRYVLAIQVPSSLNAPHRVLNTKEFYGRTASGKYPMDVLDLRSAFLRFGRLADDIRSFRDQRIEIIESSPPVALPKISVRVLMHVFPQEALVRPTVRDASEFSAYQDLRPPPHFAGYTGAYNADGFLRYSATGDFADSYIQVFRNGITESVAAWTTTLENGKLFLPNVFEPVFVEALSGLMRAYRDLSYSYPFFVVFSVTRASGVYLSRQNSSRHGRFESMNILAPEVEIWRDEGIAESLRLAFDVINNAAGYSRSQHYSQDGEWNPEGY